MKTNVFLRYGRKIHVYCSRHWMSLRSSGDRYSHCQIRRRIKKLVCGPDVTPDGLKDLFGSILPGVSGVERFLTTEEQQRYLHAAEKVLAHRFSFLGVDDHFGAAIDWHRDYKSGFRWPPGTFYKEYEQVNLTNNADVKIPRELSRGHHLLRLGIAYQITKDDRYAAEIRAQMDDWIVQNPFMFSINWGCAMDVAIRAVNWIWALAMIIEAAGCTEPFLRRVMTSLYEHGFFLSRNLERYEWSGNHYIADLVGLFYLGLVFGSVGEGRRWRQYALGELIREITVQITASGVDHERAISYHRLVTEMLISVYALLVHANDPRKEEFCAPVYGLCNFILYYTKPDGEAPVIGDQDNGRLHPFGLQPVQDHRYLLCLGAIMFNDPHMKKRAGAFAIDSFFLLGKDSASRFEQVPDTGGEPTSKSFSDAGYYIMRHGNDYMLINAGGKGASLYRARGTHAHSDALSFELFMGDKTFLVDPGTFAYSGDIQQRHLFRSTAMHNTVTVDDLDQDILVPEVLWDFQERAFPRVRIWETDEDRDLFVGEHTGYERLSRGVRHIRRIVFYKKKRVWEIEDLLEGEGVHSFKWFFHFGQRITFRINGSELTTTCLNGENIHMLFEPSGAIQLIRAKSGLSPRYGEREEAELLTVILRAAAPVTMRTTIRNR